MINIIRKKIIGHIIPVIWTVFDNKEVILVFDDLSIFEDTDWIELSDYDKFLLCRKRLSAESKEVIIKRFEATGAFEPSESGWVYALKMAEELDRTFVYRNSTF